MQVNIVRASRSVVAHSLKSFNKAYNSPHLTPFLLNFDRVQQSQFSHSARQYSATSVRASQPGVGNPSTVQQLPSTAGEVPPQAGSSQSQSPAPPIPTSFDSLPQTPNDDSSATDWSKSYHGLSAEPFPKEAAEVLMAPIDQLNIEIKPDGLIYLPEIKYRRILNKAFGPGGWGLAPRSETNVGPRIVSREYALVCLGRLVAVARGEQEYFDPAGVSTATEGCKSNALMRCCKDLGIASELWDPRFVREFKVKHCIDVFVTDLRTNKKKKLWRRRDSPKIDTYPYKE